MNKSTFETKDYTLLYTPDNIADKVVELAEPKRIDSILEPSAGNGQLIRAIRRRVPGVNIYYYEIQTTVSFQTFLQTNNSVYCGTDFMGGNTPCFDVIVANPPFEEDMWCTHLNKMWKCLNTNGRLVSIIPKQSVTGNKELYSRFQNAIKGLEKESKLELSVYPIENWYTNKDGSKLPIMIIKMRKL